MAVSSSQLRGLVDGIGELYRPDGSDFPARVVRVVTTLMGTDSCSYNHFGQQGVLGVHRRPADGGICADAIRIFEEHLPEHPVLACHRATGTGDALRISDFLSDREFRALGLYSEYYCRAGTNYQLGFSVPAPEGGLISIALGRQHSDFPDDETELMRLLRPHIERAVTISDLLHQPLPGALRGPDGSPLLTARQVSIIRLVAAGHADRNIARSLGISPRTVHAHLQNVYRALDVASRTEAVARLRAVSLSGAPVSGS